MCISGLSNLIFHLLRGRVSGENCHFRLRSTTSGTHFVIHVSFPSTVDNFRYTFRSLQYSFIASYDAKNELKKSNAPGFAEGGWAVLALTGTLGVFLD